MKRSFGFAHLFEQCLNFKSPSMKVYQTAKFNELVDQLTNMFVTIPPPKPSGTAGYASLPAVTMNGIMDRNNGCILETCRVRLQNGTWKKIIDLIKGDVLMNGSKVVCLIKSKYEGMLVKINDLIITPYHPFLINNDEKWMFPIDYYTNRIEPCGELVMLNESSSKWVCNLVLDSGHLADVEGIKCATLGHGFTEDIVQHDYYGTSKVIEDLKYLDGWDNGCVTLTDFKVKRDNKGDVIGTYDHQQLHIQKVY
jgi:hypothetical protein